MASKRLVGLSNYLVRILGFVLFFGIGWKLAIIHSSQQEIIAVPVKSNFVFLKTHKTAGSSIQNMCLRYGSENNLLIAIPAKTNYFGHPQPFEASMVPRLTCGYNYHILTHHTRFNYENIKAFMPGETVFFTLLREPASLFESSYSYYHLAGFYRKSLEEYANSEKSAMGQWLDKRFGGRIGRNQMSFDLGVEIDQFENEGYIRQVAERLNDQFHLVMVNERMNQSLVLLKHLLNWTTDDVVILHQNARKDSLKKHLTPELNAKILEWNKADKIIYDYFLKIFEEKVNAFGAERMNEEVTELSERIDEWYAYCMEETVSKKTSDVTLFKLVNKKNETCRYLSKEELAFTDEILKRQMQFIAPSCNV